MPIVNESGRTILTVEQLGTQTLFSVPTGTTAYFYKKLTWLAADFYMNRLGLYVFPEIMTNNKAKLVGFKGPRHTLRKKRPNCAWNPNGKIRTDVSELQVFDYIQQMEECPDTFDMTCLQQIVSRAGEADSFFNTPEGTALLNSFSRMAIESKATSMSQLAHFANHPLIATMNSNGRYPGDTDFEGYYAQQTEQEDHIGIYSAIDTYAAQGEAGYYDDLITTDANGDFNGDIEDLLKAMTRNVPNHTFGRIIKSGMENTAGPRMAAIGILTDQLFDALQDFVSTIGNGTVENYRYRMTLNDGIINMDNTIKWGGVVYVRDEETAYFDMITGVKTHRALITAPGNFAVPFDVLPTANGETSGLKVQVSNDLRDQNKVYMQSNIRTGSHLVDSQFATAAVKHLVPAS